MMKLHYILYRLLKIIRLMIEKIASKTFSSQFMSLEKSQLISPFQRMVSAIKNNRIDLLNSIPQSKDQLKAKDSGQKSLLFYAVYQKNQLPFLFLLLSGLDYKDIDVEHKNIYHFITYSGSIQCLKTLNFYIKLTKLKKLNENLLNILTKYGYKRTDMKDGRLKFSVSPKRQALFKQLQNQATQLYRRYLHQYQQQFFQMLSSKEQINQRNPIHLGCLNAYQKCLPTLQQVFYQLQEPNIRLNEKILGNLNAVNQYFANKLDPRNFQQTLECLSHIPEAKISQSIKKSYQRDFKIKIRELLNVKDKDGRSALYIASKNGSTAMINFLQKYASDPKVQQKEKIMKVADHNLARSHILDLCQASKIADVKNLNFLISCGDSVNEKKSIFGTFALIQAIKSFPQKRSLQPLRTLLKSGADINAQDTNGWTALHHACYEGYPQVVEELLNTSTQYRLDIKKVTNKRYHAIHLASMNQHPQIIKILVQHPKAKVNIDVPDWDGCTALIHAAKKGSIKVLKQLLDMKADIYAKDIRDMTALHHAAFSYHPQCIRQLLNYDSDNDKLRQIRNTKGKLAKDLCTQNKCFQNVFNAARTGNVNLIRKLTAQNPNLKDSVTTQKNRTPLILAVLAKSLISVKFLVEIGADTYHQDKQQKSAMAYCEDLLIKSRKDKKQDDIKTLQQIKKLLQS